jgi:hypothetical protein
MDKPKKTLGITRPYDEEHQKTEHKLGRLQSQPQTSKELNQE